MDWLSEIAAEIKIDSLPGAYQEVAQVFGVEGVLKLSRHVGGMRFYFPKLDSLIRDKRDEHIRKEFTGFNHRDLARKYGLSETWIRDIVQARPVRENQQSLFDDIT